MLSTVFEQQRSDRTIAPKSCLACINVTLPVYLRTGHMKKSHSKFALFCTWRMHHPEQVNIFPLFSNDTWRSQK